MKTEDLVTMLATGAGAVEPWAVVHHYAGAVGAGVIVAMGMMATLLGVNANLVRDAAVPMVWVKFAFVAWLFAGALLATLRLGRPRPHPRSGAQPPAAPLRPPRWRASLLSLQSS
jgi:hypothetical protein